MVSFLEGGMFFTMVLKLSIAQLPEQRPATVSAAQRRFWARPDAFAKPSMALAGIFIDCTARQMPMDRLFFSGIA